MKKKALALLLLFVFTLGLNAQKTTVKGQVIDYSEQRAIEFVSIRVSNADSLAVGATSSGSDGQFELKLDSGRFLLEASFLGYDTYKSSFEIKENTPVFVLDSIFLLEKSIELDGVSVVGRPPAVVVKGDTVEYSVGAYQADEHDALQDIVRKLPGVELDAEGNLKANGKAIDKILIDGKEFFGNDIKRALTDLPAKMIQKIQLFKKDTEEAEMTGIKSEENQEQVLNLQVKDEAKKSIFGDIEAGYGTEDKYNVSGSLYRMRDDKQLMARGSVNNLNIQQERMMYGGGYSAGGGASGITENKEFALTYNTGDRKAKSKLETESSMNYDDNRNLDRSETETQYFLSTGDRFSQGNSTSESQTKKLEANTRLTWKPDSLTNIYVRANLGHSSTFRSNTSDGRSYVSDTTYTSVDSHSDGTSDFGSINLYGSRILGNKKRLLTFQMRQNFQNGDDEGFNVSSTTYSSLTETPIHLNQKSQTNSKNYSWNLGVGYSEPLTDSIQMTFSYGITKNISKRDKETMKMDASGEYSIVDPDYSRHSENTYQTHRIGVGIQSYKSKYYYNLGVYVMPQVMQTKAAFRDSIIDDLKQNTTNFSPNLNFGWNPDKSTSLRFFYYGMTEQPSLSQLSSDTTMLSATSKRYGNPNLKTGFRNDFNVYYNKTNTEKEEFFSVYGGGGYNLNTIVNYTVMDSLGGYSTTYRNVSGDIRFYSGVNYSRMIKKIRASVYGGLNYSKNKGYVNGLASLTDNYGLSSNLNLSYSHAKVDVSLVARISTNFTSSNISASQDLDMTNYGFTSRFVWRMPLDFTFNNELSYSHNSKISDDLPQSNTSWNITLSKAVLKGKKGILKLYANNVLNEKNDIERNTSDSQISYTRTNTLGRYVLFSFAYKFNIMGK